MKTLKSTALVLGLFALLAGTTTLVRAQDYQNDYQNDGYSTGNISLQTFYDELSPYGTWIQDPQYGYVWRPDVNQSDFRPYYTNGRWAMTEYGNTWVSNYDWGWAPFHYGRWVINSYRQWIWLPDTNWGPAWVDWRSGDGYYGWAPMAPSISINLSFGRRYVVPEFCWNFIPQRNIYINTFPRYDYGRNNVYIRNTTIINNTYVYNRRSYYGGPRIEDIRRATNRDVTVYRYAQSSRPGASRVGGREVSIYRPRPERNAVDNRNAAPRRFEQGNAGISRNGRNEGYTNRDQRGGNPGNNDNRFGSRDNRTSTQPDRNSGTLGRDNNQPNNRGEVYNRDANGRVSRGGTNGIDNGNRPDNANRGQDQQRLEQIRQQRNQDRMSADQQRTQRDMQPQQRGQDDQQRAQMEQQRAQRNEQMQQQRAQQAQQQQQERTQRNEQMQQQRAQQAQQQQQERAQRDAQAQQQRAQQAQQQQQQERVQRDAQAQQQRTQQQQQRQEQRREAPSQQQRGGGESGRPSRGGRG
jgi:flagellar biosynthesis GTPase FlhF